MAASRSEVEAEVEAMAAALVLGAELAAACDRLEKARLATVAVKEAMMVDDEMEEVVVMSRSEWLLAITIISASLSAITCLSVGLDLT